MHAKLLQQIEEKRKELEMVADREGLASPSVIKVSQELDVLVYNCQQLDSWERVREFGGVFYHHKLSNGDSIIYDVKSNIFLYSHCYSEDVISEEIALFLIYGEGKEMQ